VTAQAPNPQHSQRKRNIQMTQTNKTIEEEFIELFDNWTSNTTTEQNPKDEQSQHPEAEDYTNPENGHNPYQEVARLKKAMKIATIAIHHNKNPTEENCYTIAKQIRCNKPSQRTIELVQELVNTNNTYNQTTTNNETEKPSDKTPPKNGAQQKKTKTRTKK